MAIGQLDLQEYVSGIRSAESDATLKAQAVEKGSMQIEATKKATADEETMRKGLADIYAEKPKTDTPEPPKATEPGGYETPEMKAKGVVPPRITDFYKQKKAEADQISLEKEQLKKKAALLDSTGHAALAQAAREELDGVDKKHRDAQVEVTALQDKQLEKMAQSAAGYLGGNKTDADWNKTIYDLVSSGNLDESEALRYINMKDPAQRDQLAHGLVDGAATHAERARASAVQAQIKGRADVKEADISFKEKELKVKDAVAASVIQLNEAKTRDIPIKERMTAYKNSVDAIAKNVKLHGDAYNQSIARQKILAAQHKEIANNYLLSSEDRTDQLAINEGQMAGEVKRSNDYQNTFNEGNDQFDELLKGTDNKEIKALISQGKNSYRPSQAPSEATPEAPASQTPASAAPGGDPYAGQSPEKLQALAKSAYATLVKQGDTEGAKRVKDTFEKQHPGTTLDTPVQQVKPAEAVKPTPTVKPVVKAPEMSAMDKELMAALNKTSVGEDIADFASSAASKLASAVKSGGGLRAKQEAEFAGYDKLSAYAKTKMQDKDFMSKLSDKQKAKLTEVSKMTGAAKRKEFMESDSPFDLLPPDIAANAIKIGGKPLADKIEKVLERSPSEIEKHMASLEKRIANATEGANIKRLRGFDKQAEDDLQMVKEELRLINKAISMNKSVFE